MKTLIINGSPHAKGNTGRAIEELVKTFAQEGVETEVLHVGNKQISGCVACMSCAKNGKCVFDDIVNEAARKFEQANGLVIASPVYYASPNGTMISFLDRLFYSAHFDKRDKVGAAVAVARRAGTVASFDVLNKYFSISGMPVVGSQYWNDVFGRGIGDAEGDAEGLQTMRTLARNMTFLMKAIALGKEKYGLPETEEHLWTHFIR